MDDAATSFNSPAESDETRWSDRLISIALWTVVLVCPVVFLVLSIVCSLLMPDIDVTPSILDDVSGYYGPGSVAAWLLLVLGNFEFKLLFNLFIFRPLRGHEHSNLNLLDWDLDGVIFGSFAYPLITFVDLIFQLVVYSAADTQPDASIHQAIDAQFAVMHLTSAISVIALASHSLILVFFYFFQNLDDFVVNFQADKGHWRRQMRVRRTRLSLWTIMFVLSQVSLMLLTTELKVSTVSNLKHWSKRFITLVITLAVLIPDGQFSGGSTKAAWTSYAFLNLLAVPRARYKDLESDIRFPWPRASAQLSDLDQAAALAVALWVTGVGFTRWIAQLMQERREAMSRCAPEDVALPGSAATDTAVQSIDDTVRGSASHSSQLQKSPIEAFDDIDGRSGQSSS